MKKPRKYFQIEKIFIVLITFLAFFLRFYNLNSFPPGLGRDEVSVAYNAYSILKTAKDEHGRKLPVYFEAIGDQKLPVIVYISVPSIYLFGLNELGSRFPFALFGSLTIPLLYLLLKEAEKRTGENKTTFSLFASFILAVNPWHIAHSRAVYEICLGTFFFTAAIYFFYKGLQSRKWMFWSVGFFIIAFYSYSMTRLLSPLIFLYLCFLYKKEISSYNKKTISGLILFSVILLIPFFITFFDSGGIYGPSAAVITSSAKVKASITEFRSYVAASPLFFLGPLLFNRVIMTFYEYGKNMLTALSPGFYFANGSDMAGIGTNGQFFMLEIIPFIAGVVIFVKKGIKKNLFALTVLGWAALTFMTASLTIGPPYATRTLFSAVPIAIIIGQGWLSIINFLRNKKRLFDLAKIIILTAYIWHFTFYLVSYYFRFPVVYAKNWEAKTKELFEYLGKIEGDFDRIVITKPENSMYAFLLFYHKIPPESVWDGLIRYLPDAEGWPHGKSFGKYEFRPIDWSKDLRLEENIVLVSGGDEYAEHVVVDKEIMYPTRYTVFNNGYEVISIPENKPAYRIWLNKNRKQL